MKMKDYGGPAFPVQSVYIEDRDKNSRGMTLRDYFAAKAMQGMLAAAENYATNELVDYAYMIADAMLKAREEGGEV